MDGLREVYRRPGRYAWCQFMTSWKGGKPPKFIHVHDPEKNESFVATQGMGTWMEVDVEEIVQRLNGEWPGFNVTETPLTGTPKVPTESIAVPNVCTASESQ